MRTIHLDALVVGTGCAGYNAADCLFDNGVKNIAILTEGRLMGTSRNTGSDKQTYYKLSLCSDAADSVREMARDLFAGGSVNGDTALCEAAGSVRAFMKLNELGVPFPTNEYGEYVGYKTDHDPRMRASSAGPLTSKRMTEALERAVAAKGVKVYDHMQAVRLIVRQGRVHGVIALDKTRLRDEDNGIVAFLAPHVVLCTGGPAIAYEKSVFPPSQTGCTGMMLEAGAAACNLQEWQYGLASTAFRWNVSGTYQQVLPRYVSVDDKGVEREFLPDYLGSAQRALDHVFLKGYQWPFDSAKMDGSSLVDLAVHHETTALGRKVYLDFTREPAGLENGFSLLGAQAHQYLDRSGALVRTPIARLAIMNPQAIALYRSNGIDIAQERLEIAVCAQHSNGGVDVDCNWQSSISGLYAAGETAGTFGVARPGGSALNAAQVGAQRAAEHIAYSAARVKPDEQAALQTADEVRSIIAAMRSAKEDHMSVRRSMQAAMTRCAAQIRHMEGMKELLDSMPDPQLIGARGAADIAHAFKTRDMLFVQRAMLSAMTLTAETCRSRGSALVLNGHAPNALPQGLADYAYATGGQPMLDYTVRTVLQSKVFTSSFVPVRPLPKADNWFETTWKRYNQIRGIEG